MLSAGFIVSDSRFLGALAGPVRVELLKLLAMHGRMDVATIASFLPQDRSVISRHLHTMHESGILARSKVERNVYYELDGPACYRKFREITDAMEELARICCPPAEPG